MQDREKFYRIASNIVNHNTVYAHIVNGNITRFVIDTTFFLIAYSPEDKVISVDNKQNIRLRCSCSLDDLSQIEDFIKCISKMLGEDSCLLDGIE